MAGHDPYEPKNCVGALQVSQTSSCFCATAIVLGCQAPFGGRRRVGALNVGWPRAAGTSGTSDVGLHRSKI